MKKKLVKRPLRAYVSIKKADVYGYVRPDRWSGGGGGGGGWGSLGCTFSLVGLGVALPSIASGIFGAIAVSWSLHMVALYCLPDPRD